MFYELPLFDYCFVLFSGKHCEKCIKGYYGDPTNNGTCKGIPSCDVIVV